VENYRTQPDAYKAALAHAKQGTDARIYFWEDGRWGLYEIVRAPEADR
jgi:hypothetical protein